MKSLLGLVLGALCTVSAQAGTIGLSSAPDASSCDLIVPPEAGVGTFYVCALSSTPEETCGGICGAEFRIEGLPSGWVAVATPAPEATVVIGNPMGPGVNMGFPRVAEWGATPVVLYRVVVCPPSAGASSVLRVAVHASPAWPELQCPSVAGACFDQWVHCVQGGALFINSSIPCTVAVSEKTWGQMKALYR